MELAFQKESFGWMVPKVRQIQTREQTQELKLSDGMPDIGRVLAGWGQPLLRSKEWRSDGFCVSGGMMVWVLYAPEDGTQPRCVSGWIPWQMEWDLPPGTPDGQIRVTCLTRFVDARSVSPRKILVRAGVAALGEGYVESEGAVYRPGELPEDIQLLQNTYPMRLTVEAGEKAFQLDEELILPQSCPAPGKLVSCTLHPEVTESRVLSTRVLFRGSVKVHVLYISEEGQLFSWDFPVSISQYEDLRTACSQDAQAGFEIVPTDLDISLDDEGHFRLKCGLIAQYTVEDIRQVTAVEDAYSPLREIGLDTADQQFAPTLEERIFEIPVRQTIPQDADVIADVTFLPDFPRQRTTDGKVELEIPGELQVLYYSPEGSVQSASARWETGLELPAHGESRVEALPLSGSTPEARIAGDGIRLEGQLPLAVRTWAQQDISMVTELRPGDPAEPDPGRPSLILCRAGEQSLWQLARENGSTVNAIRHASGFEGEPQPGQMLLIPVL